MYIHVTVNHGPPHFEEPEFDFDGTPDAALMEAARRYPRYTSLVLAILAGTLTPMTTDDHS